MQLVDNIIQMVSDEQLKQIEALPTNLSVRDVAKFMGLGKTTAYKVVEQEGFPKVILPGSNRILIPKSLFIPWYYKLIGYRP